MPSPSSTPDAPTGLRWTSPALLFAAIALTVLALCAVTIALPHDPYIRYQQLAKTIQFRSRWVYERITFDRTPIDVAIVGNSRLGAGISGPQLQRALRATFDRPIDVANLSMPQEGGNMRYAIVKRLLHDHPEVKLLVVSVVEQMPREGHPAFRDLADARDVLAAPKLINLDYANDVALLPYRQLSLFVQTLAPALFGDATRLDPVAYPGTDFDSTTTIHLPDGRIVDRDHLVDPVALAAAARKAVSRRNAPVLPARLAEYEFAPERAYTRAIAALARAHGATLIFVQLPVYHDNSPVSEQDFYRSLGPILRPDFVASDYRLYSDYGHSNANGTRAITAWLGERIAQDDGLRRALERTLAHAR